MTQARTNLGPLTTPFTYPASCGVVVMECLTCQVGWQAQLCGSNPENTQGVEDNTECWPPRSAPASTTEVAVLGWGFYSPGIECPVGYSTACASTAGVPGGAAFQFSILPGETAVGCCPTGYACKYNPGIDNAQTCYRDYSTGSFPTVQCSSGTSDKFSYLTVPAAYTITESPSASAGSASPSVTSGVLDDVLVYAPLIQINWQSTDRATPTASSLLPEGTASTSSTGTPTPQAGGLSRGAKIGIAVAAAVVGLILSATFAAWMRRRGRRRAAAMPTLPPGAYYTYADTPHEIQSMCVTEAPTESNAHEIDGTDKRGSRSPRYEMAG